MASGVAEEDEAAVESAFQDALRRQFEDLELAVQDSAEQSRGDQLDAAVARMKNGIAAAREARRLMLDALAQAGR